MPTVPAALLLDEITHRFAQATGRQVTTVKQVRFTAPLAPGQQLDVQYQPKNAAEYRFVGTEKGNPIVKGALDYTAPAIKYVPLRTNSVGELATPASLRDCYGQLPHACSMCLLDGFWYCDEQTIVCQAPVMAQHPLARNGELPAWISLEYAAQALACHGLLTLSAQNEQTAFCRAMLIGVREMTCYAAVLDPTLPCRVEVSLLAQQPGAASCSFTVTQPGPEHRDGQTARLVSAGQFNTVYQGIRAGGPCGPSGVSSPDGTQL